MSVILFLQTNSIVQEHVPLSNNVYGSLLCSLLTKHVIDMHNKLPKVKLVCSPPRFALTIDTPASSEITSSTIFNHYKALMFLFLYQKCKLLLLHNTSARELITLIGITFSEAHKQNTLTYLK